MGGNDERQGAVLIGDVDRSRMAQLAGRFGARGLLPSLAFTTHQMSEFLNASAFDLVLLALDLTGSDGNDAFVAHVARHSSAPLIALDDHARLGPGPLQQGAAMVLPGRAAADDICVAALSQLRRGPGRKSARVLRRGALLLDEHRRTAEWDGRDLQLTRLQHRLLITLLDANGAVVSYAELERRTYGTAVIDGSERVMSQVRRIREKIEQDPGRPSFLLTVRGEGFRLADTRAREAVTP